MLPKLYYKEQIAITLEGPFLRNSNSNDSQHFISVALNAIGTENEVRYRFLFILKKKINNLIFFGFSFKENWPNMAYSNSRLY